MNFVVIGCRVSASPEQGAGPTLDIREEAALGSVYLTLLDCYNVQRSEQDRYV